ncbi:MAG: hypothetical protein AB7P14_06720 [Blastocatellales bacterium]
MIANDLELRVTQERIAHFCKLLAQMRAAAKSPEEYRLYSNSYLAEIEEMNAEVLEYLKQPAIETKSAEAA